MPWQTGRTSPSLCFWLYKCVSVGVCSSDLWKWQKCHTLNLCSSKKLGCLGCHRSDKLLQRSRGRRRQEEAVRSVTLTTAAPPPSPSLTLSMSPSLSTYEIAVSHFSVFSLLQLSTSVFPLSFDFLLYTSAFKL